MRIFLILFLFLLLNGCYTTTTIPNNNLGVNSRYYLNVEPVPYNYYYYNPYMITPRYYSPNYIIVKPHHHPHINHYYGPRKGR